MGYIRYKFISPSTFARVRCRIGMTEVGVGHEVVVGVDGKGAFLGGGAHVARVYRPTASSG